MKVADLSGAAVPGVQVTIAPQQNPQAARQSRTGVDGIASFQLPMGVYTVGAEAPGFRTHVQENVNLACGSHIDVQLQIGVLMGDVVEVRDVGPLQKAKFAIRSVFTRLRRGV